MNTSPTPRRVPRKTAHTIEQVSESLYLELLQLQHGTQTLDQYTERVGIWMRLLADNTGIDRGSWEVR